MTQRMDTGSDIDDNDAGGGGWRGVDDIIGIIVHEFGPQMQLS